MDPIVVELREKHLSTLVMWEGVVDACPARLWSLPDAPSPFWREAYHCIFWQHNYFNGPGCAPELRPFGRGVDPRLFTPVGAVVGRGDMRSFGRQTREHIQSVSETLSPDQLTVADEFEPGESTTTLHRTLYGLRHAQHHIGKLTQLLAFDEVVIDNWR